MKTAIALPRSIVFLCQHCHGALEVMARLTAGRRVWRCTECRTEFVYTDAGWQAGPTE
jgi:hypothetical protein